jgi:hypothetical protein
MTCSQSRRPKPWRGQPVVAASHDADPLEGLPPPSRNPKGPSNIAMTTTASSAAEMSYVGEASDVTLLGRLRLAASTPASPPSLLRVSPGMLWPLICLFPRQAASALNERCRDPAMQP